MSSSRREILAEGASRMGLALAEPALERLLAYYSELLKWNRKINLVARAPELELLETHFLDSLSLLPLLPENSSAAPPLGAISPACLPDTARRQAACHNPGHRGRVTIPAAPLPLLDIGSGAGFPGLVLKCCRPESLDVTLAEPRQKRGAFLRQVIRSLALGPGIRVMDRRLEPGENGTWPLITSRAFASIADFLNLCATLCPPGGRVICMKGPRAEEELACWQRQEQSHLFQLQEIRPLSLPFSGATRYLLLFHRC